MRMQQSKFILLFFLIGLTCMTACHKAPDYPNEPHISFNSIRVVPSYNKDIFANVDSVYVTINFEDGNGDLGNETSSITSGTPKDYFLKTFKAQNGVFTELDLSSIGGFATDGYLPLLSPTSAVGPIDGTLTYSLSFIKPGATIPGYPINKGDTLRFEVRIRDRAGNFSEWTTSSNYILWQSF
jgi:hypothetical protein